MKKVDIITAMDLCVDLLLQMGDILPEFGQKEQLIPDYGLEMGGSCSIFASQAAKLGLDTVGIGVVGRDMLGRFLQEALAQSGVITDFIREDAGLKTGMGAALCKQDGDRAILTYSGSIDAVTPEDIKDEILKAGRHLHIGSYYLMKRLQPHFADIAKKAKQWGLTISLDTNWDPDEIWDGGIWELLPLVDIFLPNENEAKWITKKDTVSEAVAALSRVVPTVALKMGKQGAMAYTGGQEYTAASLPVDVVDAVGAGDSFDAGFVYGFLAGLEWSKCLELGCICGSLSTTRGGGTAGQPNLETLVRYQHI